MNELCPGKKRGKTEKISNKKFYIIWKGSSEQVTQVKEIFTKNCCNPRNLILREWRAGLRTRMWRTRMVGLCGCCMGPGLSSPIEMQDKRLVQTK